MSYFYWKKELLETYLDVSLPAQNKTYKNKNYEKIFSSCYDGFRFSC